MRINQVQIPVSDVEGAMGFYRSLGFVADAADGTAAIRIGRSTLTLVPGDPGPGVLHSAWTVPANSFAEAKAWLQDRVPLLGRDGQDEFALDPPWSSRSVYFAGPDGILLELIARHELPETSVAPFRAADVVCISEIGVSVPSVPAAVRRLRADFGLPVFGTGSEDFTPLGDHHGLLIVVRDGRPWFPTNEHLPSQAPLVVEFDDGRTLRTGELR